MTESGQKKAYQDDEIDLVELIVDIWKGKIIILLFVVCSLAAGFAYVKTAPQVYEVSSGLTVNLHSSDAFKFCNNVACLDQNTLDSYAGLLQKWSIDARSSRVSRNVSSVPEDTSTYFTELESANNELTQGLLENSKENLKMASELSSDLRSTDTVADTVWNSKKIVSSIEDKNVKALSFSGFDVKKQSPKVTLIIVLSVLLGGMLGVFAVLLRKPFVELKRRLTTKE